MTNDNYRNNDPDTSRQASESFESVRAIRKAQFLNGLQGIGGIGTAREASRFVTSDPVLSDSIRRRASDLSKSNVIEIIGTRVCTVSTHKASVYKLKEEDDNGCITERGPDVRQDEGDRNIVNRGGCGASCVDVGVPDCNAVGNTSEIYCQRSLPFPDADNEQSDH